MTVKDIIEANGHIYVIKPELFRKNVDILKNFGIDIMSCNPGKGIQVLGYLDLAQRLETIKEMGYDDEVLKNPANSLELIRGYSMSLNYNIYKDNCVRYVKGAA